MFFQDRRKKKRAPFPVFLFHSMMGWLGLSGLNQLSWLPDCSSVFNSHKYVVHVIRLKFAFLRIGLWLNLRELFFWLFSHLGLQLLSISNERGRRLFCCGIIFCGSICMFINGNSIKAGMVFSILWAKNWQFATHDTRVIIGTLMHHWFELERARNNNFIKLFL